jgi:hypothetical protein
MEVVSFNEEDKDGEADSGYGPQQDPLTGG